MSGLGLEIIIEEHSVRWKKEVFGDLLGKFEGLLEWVESVDK